MKKFIFSTLMGVCLLTAALSAQREVIDYFDDNKYVVYSETIQHPVLARVFPGIEFRKESSYTCLPPRERIIGLSDGYKKVMPWAFNTLYAQVADSSKASLDERLETFVRLAYWTRDPDLEIVKQEEVKVEGRWFTFNNRVVIRIQRKGLEPQQHELLILFDRDQIVRVEIYVDGKKSSLIQPILIGATDQIDLQISGPNLLHTQELHDPPNGPLYDHYYVIVSENGMATVDKYIDFTITGAEPSVIIRLLVIPIYGYTDPFYEGEAISNPQGEVAFRWDPESNNDETGICGIVVEENGIPIPEENTWVIPERTLTGIFPSGYNYRVYYTDQFFINHPNGITHALTFANQVADALVDSWDKQVNEWDLCQGLYPEQPNDNDGWYETFINDSEGGQETPNMYHRTFTTQATVEGYEREIGVGSRINTYPQFPNEVDRIYSAICHEFYHGIQLSLNLPTWYYGVPIGMLWLVEGQARFLPTVFMDEFSSPNVEFLDISLYHEDSNEYLNMFLNTSLITTTQGFGYTYCLFWRFLYENYISGTVTQKLAIIRETCRGNTVANMPQIEIEMDNALQGYLGEYDTMDEAIRVFAKHAYFNDPPYNLWQPLPGPDFYIDPPDLHLSDSFTYGIYDPEEGYILQEHDYEGEIPYVWGIDYLLYNFEQFLELPAATLTFNRDPDNNGTMGEFGLDVYTEDALTHQITTYPLIIIGEDSQVTFNLDTDIQDHAVVAITRQDANELDEEYYVNITSGITVDVEALYPPVIICSERGGVIHYNLTVKNNSSQSVSADIWCSITYPGGAHIEDIYTTSQDLYPGQDWEEQLVREIPIGYTPDIYHLKGYVGQIHPGSNDSKWDRDYFEFRVVDEEAAEPEIAWINHYGRNGNDHGYDAFEASNGDFYAVGGSVGDFYRLRTHANGTFIQGWVERRADCAYSINPVTIMEPIPLEGHLMAGSSTYLGDSDIFMRIEKPPPYVGGWSWWCDVGIGSHDIGYDALQASDGDYIVAGVSDVDFCLVKARYPQVFPIWTRTYDNNGNIDIGQALDQTADGGYIIAGWTCLTGPSADYDVYVVKTDASGNEEWNLQHNPPGDYWDYGYDVIQTFNGDYVIAGTANDWFSGPQTGDVYVFRMRAEDNVSNVLWELAYAPFDTDIYSGKGLCQCDDGGFIVVGYHYGYHTIDGQDVIVIRLDGAGNVIWEMDIDYPPDDDGSYEQGESIRQIADGGYIIAGYVKLPGAEGEVLLVRLEPENFVNQIFGIPPEYEIISVKPADYSLIQNFPNPFNPTTTLSFELRDAGFVNLAVYDISGRLVATLINGWRQAGNQEVTFDGSGLASGVYFYRIEAGDFTAVKKMILMK